MQNLRDKEVHVLGKMMTIEKGLETTESFADQWKVLVYDHDCRDIISPLMNVGALRQKGITLHLLIGTEREAISDAPAVYFVRPTEENINRIADDCAKRLYRSFYLHFVTRIDRQLLETLARKLVESNSVSLISKVYDEYLDVIALEPALFTLNVKNSFIAYNDPSLGEMEIRGFISRMSSGLLSMIRVLGSLPVIRAPPGGCAQMLAEDLCSILRENVSPRGAAQSLFADCLVSERSRPLLLIIDRTGDMAPPLLHTSSYQALVDDLLDHRLNRVTIDLPGKDGAAGKKKTYDLNTQADNFYSRYAAAIFPDAVEANEKELAECSQREADIRSRPSSGAEATTPSSAAASIDGAGKDLSDAIESLPEILQKKATLETHTNILQAVMRNIAAREIPTYFEIEQAILAAGKVTDKAAVLGLLRDGTKGNLEDKARLLAVTSCALSTAETGSAAVAAGKALAEEFDAAFAAGCGALGSPPTEIQINQALAAVAFIRKLQSLQSSSMGGGGGGAGNAYLTSLLSSAQSGASALMAKAASLFTKFVPMYVTRVVEALAEGRSGPEDDTFCTLDPKLQAGEYPTADSRQQRYSEVIVFVVGGGCYSEFNNLQDLLKQKAAGSGTTLKSVTYGCSELLSGGEFLDQLMKLGSPSA